MTRSLTAEETAALPPMPLGLPRDVPLTLRETVWASAYAADFARQFAECWSAASGAEWSPERGTVLWTSRTEAANAGVDVARCKAVADAAVERMG